MLIIPAIPTHRQVRFSDQKNLSFHRQMEEMENGT